MEPKRQILFLCKKSYYLHRLSRVRFHAVKAIGKLCKVTFSGPGWENWDDTLSAKENIKQKPDLIIVYRPDEIPGFPDLPFPSCGLYDELNTEDNPKQATLEELSRNKIDLVISHQLRQMEDPDFSTLKSKFYYIPYSGEKSLFKDYGLKKEIDVLLVGNLGKRRYPFRDRLFHLMEKWKDDPLFSKIRLEIFPYPGYRLPDAYTEKHVEMYARWMNSAKICLTDSGIHHLKYAKYVEIPLCRSLLMADLPDEDQEFLKTFMVVLTPQNSDDEIAQKILYYLENEEERNRLTDIGYHANLERYTQENYAERFVKILETYLKENKGGKRW